MGLDGGARTQQKPVCVSLARLLNCHMRHSLCFPRSSLRLSATAVCMCTQEVSEVSGCSVVQCPSPWLCRKHCAVVVRRCSLGATDSHWSESSFHLPLPSPTHRGLWFPRIDHHSVSSCSNTTEACDITLWSVLTHYFNYSKMGSLWRTVALVALVLALVLATTSANAAESAPLRKQATRVVTINSQNFDEYFSTPQTRYVMVLYCVSWSEACKGIMNTYHHLSITMARGRFRNVVTIAYVDGDKEPGILERMNVKGFPSLIYYTPLEPQGAEFSGFREHALLESFIFQYT